MKYGGQSWLDEEGKEEKKRKRKGTAETYWTVNFHSTATCLFTSSVCIPELQHPTKWLLKKLWMRIYKFIVQETYSNTSFVQWSYSFSFIPVLHMLQWTVLNDRWAEDRIHDMPLRITVFVVILLMGIISLCKLLIPT